MTHQSSHSPRSYQVVFAPGSGITPEEFVRLWNADAERQASLPAHTAPATGQAAAFGDPLSTAIVILENIAAGMAGNALYDIVKRVIAARTREAPLEIVEADPASDSPLLIVAPAEEPLDQ